MSKEESEIIKRQICVLGDKENKWKKYLYLENGILVGEKFVKIENGVEILCEETGSANYTVTLPPNFENEEKLNVVNTITNETSQIKVIQQPQKIEFLKLYNETKNIGIINRIENGLHTGCQYFRIENNQEVICEPPESDGKFYFVPLPDGVPDFSSYNGNISIYDTSTKTAAMNIPKAKIIKVDENVEIKIKEDDSKITEDLIAKVNELSSDEKERFIESIQKTCEPVISLEGKEVTTSTIDQVAQTIGMILANESEEIPSQFYKTIDPKEEFGISRVVADKIYNLPKLLENVVLAREGDTTYIIKAEAQDSYNNSIRLEHRLQATSPEEAQRIAQVVVKKLKGIQLKILTACWKMANTKNRPTFTCRLTELMKYSNPLRQAHFNSAERLEFYEHLRSLENTKFVYTRYFKERKKEKEESYEIRLLEIHHRKGVKDEDTPQELTMTILNTHALQKQKMTFVGVGVKNRTLELHADNTMLANFIQTRKNQNMKATYLTLERDSLIKMVGLSKTNEKNKAEANRLLIEQLSRLKEKGIIFSYPKRINASISLKVR